MKYTLDDGVGRFHNNVDGIVYYVSYGRRLGRLWVCPRDPKTRPSGSGAPPSPGPWPPGGRSPSPIKRPGAPTAYDASEAATTPSSPRTCCAIRIRRPPRRGFPARRRLAAPVRRDAAA